MSQDKTVDIDITKRPGSGVKSDDKGYYYESNSGRVDLTDEWYPDPDGTYRKITHAPEKGKKIGSITHNSAPQNGFPNLDKYSSVSVYYWSLDNTFKNPLLIQLGDSKDKYYKYSGSGDNWTNDPGASNNLRDSLNKQNCDRNKAHVVDLSYKSSTNYPCPVIGCSTQIAVAPANYGNDYYRSAHYTTGSSISVSGFKDKDNWHTGLPTVKNLQKVLVYWNSTSGGIPVLIHYQKSGEHWFRRNTKDGNTWTALPNEISNEQALELLNDRDYYPKVTIKLSMPANAPYPDEGTKINITVRSSFIEGGYYISRHSLCGGLFKVTQVKHGQGTTLNGISSNYPIESVTAYYNGDDYITKDPILVELAVKNTSKTGYIYYGKSTAQDNSWRAFLNSGTRHDEYYLRNKLKSMRETKLLPSNTTDIIETTLIVTDVLAGGGSLGFGGWKLFGVLATRL